MAPRAATARFETGSQFAASAACLAMQLYTPLVLRLLRIPSILRHRNMAPVIGDYSSNDRSSSTEQVRQHYGRPGRMKHS